MDKLIHMTGRKLNKYERFFRKYLIPRWALYANMLTKPILVGFIFSVFWGWFRYKRSGSFFDTGALDQNNYEIVFGVLGGAFAFVAARIFDDILKQYYALINAIKQNDVVTYMKNRNLRSSRFVHLLLAYIFVVLALVLVLLPFDSLAHNIVLMFVFVSFAVLWWNIATDLDNYNTGKLRVYVPEKWAKLDDYDFWVLYWTNPKQASTKYLLTRKEIEECARK